MKPSFLLHKAKALIEKGWTQGEYARDASGIRAGTESAEATCWCSSGALMLAIRRAGSLDAAANAPYSYLNAAITDVGSYGEDRVISFNDAKGRTKEEVLAVFDKAIELAEAAEAQ